MTTDMLFAIEREVVRESETGASTKTRSYAFDALGQRATLSENGSRYSYVVDQRESVVALLDQTNGIKAAYGYRAYGEANPSLTKTAGGFTPSTNLYRYSGKRFDPAAKAYDMGARHYFPSQARWFQQDLYADALDNLGLSTDPLNSNRYLFTGANPINYIELDGHAAGAVGPTYDGGTGDPDPTRQAGLMADAFVRLGCRSTQRAECAGAISGIEQQLRLYSNQKLLCAQTRDARHCTAGAGAKELLSIADTLTTFTGMGGITKTGIKFSVKKIIKEIAKRRAAKSAQAVDQGFAVGAGFRSFSQAKRVLGPAGEGKQWHHLVEQTPGNVGRFGPQVIHNTGNLVRLDTAVHRQVSGYFSSKQPFTGGQTVRQWLSGQSYARQQQFARQVMERFGR